MIDVILKNATVLTMNPVRPRMEAVLFRGRHIITAGTLQECRAACVDELPTEIDLAGRTVIPGFNDAHLHLVATGKRAKQLSLAGMSRDQIIEAVRAGAEDLPPGALLQAYGWDYQECPEPSLSLLDAAASNRPVILTQFSGHGAWVNSVALRQLGITKSKRTWHQGGADADESGALTGVLREPAYAPGYRRLLIRQSRNQQATLEAMKDGMELLTTLGITSCADNVWYPWHVDRLADLYHRGEQTVRVNAWSWGARRGWDWMFSQKAFRDEWYERGAHKFFADGAFSSYTAWLSEPYADKPETSGSGMSSEEMVPFIRRLTRSGSQIAIHSIGDAATSAFLDAVERVSVGSGGTVSACRHRIEHAQLISDEDIERISRLGLVVSAQPHAAATPKKDVRLIGEERAQRAYPFRALLDAGIPLAFGSDYPGEATVAPLEGIHLAVNREGGQAITTEEAIRAYTHGGAFAEFAEEKKGMIRKGLLADMAILSDDPTAIAPKKIREIRVDATLVDGNLVYVRDGVDLDTDHGISTSCQPSARPAESAQAGSFHSGMPRM
jgi:predicted amidohydrolase YtcJ